MYTCCVEVGNNVLSKQSCPDLGMRLLFKYCSNTNNARQITAPGLGLALGTELKRSERCLWIAQQGSVGQMGKQTITWFFSADKS